MVHRCLKTDSSRTHGMDKGCVWGCGEGALKYIILAKSLIKNKNLTLKFQLSRWNVVHRCLRTDSSRTYGMD